VRLATISLIGGDPDHNADTGILKGIFTTVVYIGEGNGKLY